MSARRHAWLLLAPLPAAALGACVASLHGVGLAAFVPNALAVVLGIAIAIALRSRPSIRERWLPLAALLTIALTLTMPDLEGVHRWLVLGPVRLHASAALLPWLFAALLPAEPRMRRRAVFLVCGVQGLQLVQPDAAQATALAVGALPLLAGGVVVPRRVGIPVAALLLGLAILTGLRPDPLAPVDHVEGILALAAARGGVWPAAVAVSALALLAPALLAMRARDPLEMQLGAGLTLYGCATLGATFFGSFPVPVFGAGAGPVLGWYAMLTVLAGRGRVRESSTSR